MIAEERVKMLVEEYAGIMDWEWIIAEAIKLTAAETLGRCAKVADRYATDSLGDDAGWAGKQIAIEIRALGHLREE